MQVVYQIVKKVQNRRCHCFNIHCLELDLAGPDFDKSRDGRPDLNLFKIFQMTFSNFQIRSAIFGLSPTSPSPLAFLFIFGKDKNNLIILLL